MSVMKVSPYININRIKFVVTFQFSGKCNKDWSISNLLAERDFDLKCKARFPFKIFTILLNKYKEKALYDKINNYLNNYTESFVRSYNKNILEYRNKLVHIRINKDASGHVLFFVMK